MVYSSIMRSKSKVCQRIRLEAHEIVFAQSRKLDPWQDKFEELTILIC